MVNPIDITATNVFGQSVDFGRTASEYRQYRAGFPQKFFEALELRGWITRDGNALDLGTGTGTVARGLAAYGLTVVATDPSEALLREAAQIDGELGVTIDYQMGRAENIAAPDCCFDVVTAGQCWHWFDRPKAATEIARVLKPGGRLIVAHFDWLPIRGNVVAATEELILKFNPKWTMGGGTGLYPQWLTDLADFDALETFSFDIEQPYSHEAWRGRIRASAGIKASLDAEATLAFDRALADLLRERFPKDPLSIPHRVWAVSGLRR